MKNFFLGGLAIGLALCVGCASKPVKLAVPLAMVKTIDQDPGVLVVDGVKKNVPYDAHFHYENGFFTPTYTAFKLEPVMGADLVLGNPSPWAGVRFLHIENLGFDFGFDKAYFTFGADWLWHDIMVGPSAAWPYITDFTKPLSLQSQFELKAGFLF